MASVRLAPLKPAELDERQSRFLNPFSNAKGQYPNIFGTLAHHMDLVDAWSEFGLYTMRDSDLDPLLREIVVLRAALNAGCDYEWHHHRHIALRVGLTDEQIAQIGERRAMDQESYNLLLACADELSTKKRLSEKTWDAMIGEFGTRRTIDVIFTVGAYAALAMFINSCGVEIETRPEPHAQ
jgi:4-carboxymuconolactone decarboxylase